MEAHDRVNVVAIPGVKSTARQLHQVGGRGPISHHAGKYPGPLLSAAKRATSKPGPALSQRTRRSSTTHAFAGACLQMKALVRFPAWTRARVEVSFMGPPVGPPKTGEPVRGPPKRSENARDGRDIPRLPRHEHAIFSRVLSLALLGAGSVLPVTAQRRRPAPQRLEAGGTRTASIWIHRDRARDSRQLTTLSTDSLATTVMPLSLCSCANRGAVLDTLRSILTLLSTRF